MKIQIMWLAVFTANLISAQSIIKDSTKAPVLLQEVTVNGDYNSKEIEKQNVFIPIELLIKDLTGADFIARGNFAQDPVIRNFKSAQINVNLNGMRMFGACTDRMDPVTSYAETSNLKEITVKKGSETSLSGNAHGGAVEMELKKATFNNKSQFGGMAGGSFATNTNGFNGFINLEQRSKKIGIYLQASGKKHGNYYAGGGEEVLYSQYQKVNFTLNAAYKLSDREVIRVNLLLDEAKDVGYPSLPMDVGLARANVFGLNYENYRSTGILKNYKAMVYYNSIYHEMDDTKRPNVPMHMDMPGWSDTFGAWLKGELNSGKKHELSLMLEYYQNFRKAEMTMYPVGEKPMYMLTWPDVLRHTAGIGIQDNWQLNDRNNIGLSGRVDWNHSTVTSEFGRKQLEVFGYDVDDPFVLWVLSLKANYTHRITTKTKFIFNAGYAERAPDISEQFGFYLFNANDGHDYIGDVNIKKEGAIQLETGIEYATMKWNFTTSIYFNHVNNYVLGKTDSTLSPMTIGAYGVRFYTNLEYANFSGFELNATYYLNQKWSTGANAQYTYAVDQDQQYLPLIAPLKSNLWVNYNNKGWNARVETMLAAEQDKINEDFGDLPTPGYAILNASVLKEYKLKSNVLSVELSARNIFDTWYRDHLNWGEIPMPGRTIMARVILEF